MEPFLKQTLSRVWLAWPSKGQVHCRQLCSPGCPLEHLPVLCQASLRPECKAAGRPGALTSDPDSDGTLWGAEGKEGGGGQAPAIKGRGWWLAALPEARPRT